MTKDAHMQATDTKEDTHFRIERAFYYVAVLGMAAIIAFAVIYAALQVSSDTQSRAPEMPLYENTHAGETKPLPDYMLDNEKPDELEKLKQ